MKRKASASDTLLGQGPPQAKRRQKEGPCGTDTSPIPLAQVKKKKKKKNTSSSFVESLSHLLRYQRVRASLLRCLALHFDYDELIVALAKKVILFFYFSFESLSNNLPISLLV